MHTIGSEALTYPALSLAPLPLPWLGLLLTCTCTCHLPAYVLTGDFILLHGAGAAHAAARGTSERKARFGGERLLVAAAAAQQQQQYKFHMYCTIHMPYPTRVLYIFCLGNPGNPRYIYNRYGMLCICV